MSADDIVIPTTDGDGNPAGLLNVSDIYRYQDSVLAAALGALGKERFEVMNEVRRASVGRDAHERYAGLLGTVADLVDLLDTALAVTDALNLPIRAEILNSFGSDR